MWIDNVDSLRKEQDLQSDRRLLGGDGSNLARAGSVDNETKNALLHLVLGHQVAQEQTDLLRVLERDIDELQQQNKPVPAHVAELAFNHLKGRQQVASDLSDQALVVDGLSQQHDVSLALFLF